MSNEKYQLSDDELDNVTGGVGAPEAARQMMEFKELGSYAPIVAEFALKEFKEMKSNELAELTKLGEMKQLGEASDMAEKIAQKILTQYTELASMSHIVKRFVQAEIDKVKQ